MPLAGFSGHGRLWLQLQGHGRYCKCSGLTLSRNAAVEEGSVATVPQQAGGRTPHEWRHMFPEVRRSRRAFDRVGEYEAVKMEGDVWVG